MTAVVPKPRILDSKVATQPCYNLHPIGIKFKAYKGGQSEGKEKRTSSQLPRLLQAFKSRGNTLLTA